MPLTVNFDLQEDARRGFDAIEVELTRIGLEIEKHAAQYLDDNKINMDGDLKKSLTHEIERFQNLIRLKVGAGAKHAPYVHFGTKPHRPPREPLIRWAKKKFGYDDEKTKEIAFRAIAKITKYGTEPKPFMDYALDKVAGDFAERIEAAFIRGIG